MSLPLQCEVPLRKRSPTSRADRPLAPAHRQPPSRRSQHRTSRATGAPTAARLEPGPLRSSRDLHGVAGKAIQSWSLKLESREGRLPSRTANGCAPEPVRALSPEAGAGTASDTGAKTGEDQELQRCLAAVRRARHPELPLLGAAPGIY